MGSKLCLIVCLLSLAQAARATCTNLSGQYRNEYDQTVQGVLTINQTGCTKLNISDTEDIWVGSYTFDLDGSPKEIKKFNIHGDLSFDQVFTAKLHEQAGKTEIVITMIDKLAPENGTETIRYSPLPWPRVSSHGSQFVINKNVKQCPTFTPKCAESNGQYSVLQ